MARRKQPSISDEVLDPLLAGSNPRDTLAGKDGLLHISEVAKERIRSVEDVLSEGDEVIVKCIKVDRDGKIRLSRREALDANPAPEDVHNYII